MSRKLYDIEEKMKRAQWEHDFFMNRAIELEEDARKIEALRGEGDSHAKLVRDTSKLNIRIAKMFK